MTQTQSNWYLQCVMVVIIGMIGQQTAHACSCPSDYRVVYPYPNASAVPTNTRILGTTCAPFEPNILLEDTDDDGRVLEGKSHFVASIGGFCSVWAFTPYTPLIAGHTIWISTDRPQLEPTPFEFTVGTTMDTEIPQFGGATELLAQQLELVSVSGEFVCDSPPSVGDTFNTYMISWGKPTAIDNTTPFEALLFTTYVYRLGTTPTPVNAAFAYAMTVTQCVLGRCETGVRPSFDVGDTVCARLMVTDAAGNEAAYDKEVCSVAIGERVDYEKIGIGDVCTTNINLMDGGPQGTDSLTGDNLTGDDISMQGDSGVINLLNLQRDSMRSVAIPVIGCSIMSCTRFTVLIILVFWIFRRYDY